MKKYLVIPGMVSSINDGQPHYVSGHELARLYGVSPSECVLKTGPLQVVPPGLIELRPRRDGVYTLPHA